MRFAVDTGGTFTDLVIEDSAGRLEIHKAPTVPKDPVQGVLDVFELAARARGTSTHDLLAAGEILVHGTTHAINAVLTSRTARTAFLTTEGHPDILLFREGGRSDVFDNTRRFPQPYVPRSLTFEVRERIDSFGCVVTPLDEDCVSEIIAKLKATEVAAVGVCLLWSILNPVHEIRLGERLMSELPGVAITLSHQLNPSIREYRRASSTCIDASLKPLMATYLAGLETRLKQQGFAGRLLVVVSSGGVLDAQSVATAPIHSLNSGPAMAPVAGRYYAQREARTDLAIVADTGGTSYDVSLVRHGRIPWTRETWIGDRFFGHMTGFPSVDVKSVGAGGGSIARVDSGGLLHVGPESAGAVPGPAAYGRGGVLPTVTDACLVLGYLDPEHFLGGRMAIDSNAAFEAVRRHIAEPLGLDVNESALAIVDVATEHMVAAIEAITVHQGIDPRDAVLVGGGGAAGFNSVAIARRLGCRSLIIPRLGPALSAAGGLLSDLTRDFSVTSRTTDHEFDFSAVNSALKGLIAQCNAFIASAGSHVLSSRIEVSAEARYPHQAWELEIPVSTMEFTSEGDVDQLRHSFHEMHRQVFAIADEASPVEIESWRARAICTLRNPDLAEPASRGSDTALGARRAYFAGQGFVDTQVLWFDDLSEMTLVSGPAIIESDFTTVVLNPGSAGRRTGFGSLIVTPEAVEASAIVDLQRTSA